jgi:hypothetical protein
MILTSVRPCHIGPFGCTSTLFIDGKLTALTGPNDVGKTLALRSIQILCGDSTAVEADINRDRVSHFEGKWQDDPEICCYGTFQIPKDADARALISGKPLPGDELAVKVRVTHHDHEVVEIKRGGATVTLPLKVKKWPRILALPFPSEIRETIELRNLTHAEEEFIRLGFGTGFSVEKQVTLTQPHRTLQIHEAQTRLNSRLKELLPQALGLQFQLVEIGGKPDLLGVALVDQHFGYTLLKSRGSGVRRLVSYLGALLRIDPNAGHCIILFDEPETSLHPDAQHCLRRLLEDLGDNPMIQVIYATHSPAMVNTLRPNSIRMLERTSENRRATSRFLNNPSGANFTLVRSSLGIVPGDSLLYAPLTIVVDGSTEVFCLPLVLKRLADEGTFPMSDLELLLPMTHILDGEGSTLELMCRLAKSQGARPIVLLDGDVCANLISEMHPEVPIVQLDKGMEFEDLVLPGTYIQAAAEILNESTDDMNETKYNEWLKVANLKPSLMFSKRVERWLQDQFDKPLYKARVMVRAIELSKTGEVQAKPFHQLIEAMKEICAKL